MWKVGVQITLMQMRSLTRILLNCQAAGSHSRWSEVLAKWLRNHLPSHMTPEYQLCVMCWGQRIPAVLCSERERVDPHKWPYSPFSKKFSRSSIRFNESSWSSINFRMTANSACATGREKWTSLWYWRHHWKEGSGLIPAVLNPRACWILLFRIKLKLHGLTHNTPALLVLSRPESFYM